MIQMCSSTFYLSPPSVCNECARVAAVQITETCKQDLINIPVEQHGLWVIT